MKNTQVTNRYFGMEYNPTGKTKGDGFNCLTLCTDWLIDILDSEFRYQDEIIDGLTWENVRDEFIENPKETFNKIEEYLLKYVDIIPLKEIRKGDFAAITVKGDDVVVPAVYIGMGKVMFMTQSGIKFKGPIFYKLIKAYRKKNVN